MAYYFNKQLKLYQKKSLVKEGVYDDVTDIYAKLLCKRANVFNFLITSPILDNVCYFDRISEKGKTPVKLYLKYRETTMLCFTEFSIYISFDLYTANVTESLSIHKDFHIYEHHASIFLRCFIPNYHLVLLHGGA